MMLVDPAARRSGIGSRLMEAALDALPAMPASASTPLPPASRCIAASASTAEYELARTTVTAGQHRPSPRRPPDRAGRPARDLRPRPRGIRRRPRRAARTISTAAPPISPGSRKAHTASAVPVTATRRSGRWSPEVATSARALVDHCLAAHDGQSFVVDIPQRPDGLSFHVERPFLRMCRGSPRHREVPDQHFRDRRP